MRRLKILWLSHFVPYPPKGGAFQRSFNLIRGTGAVHEVHLLAIRHKNRTHPDEDDRRAAEVLGRHCASVRIIDGTQATSVLRLVVSAVRLAVGTPITTSISNIPAMRVAIRTKIAGEQFDLVHFDTIGLACYLPDVAGIAAVVNHHNVESFMMTRRVEREPSLLKRLLFRTEGRVLRRYEAQQCARFLCNIVVSELDSRLLAQIAPTARLSTVPNGVDVTYFYAMPPRPSHRVVFAGRLDQYSNRDAILYFSTQVWPEIRKLYPDALLNVIGSNPPNKLVDLVTRDPSIRLLGFVDDIRPHFESASVAVCPIRDGGGTRLKILDSLAMGKPIVSTSVCAEGIDVIPERDLLVADSAEAFVTQVSRIFDDHALAAQLAANARQLAVNTYSWERIIPNLLETYCLVDKYPGAPQCRGRHGP